MFKLYIQGNIKNTWFKPNKSLENLIEKFHNKYDYPRNHFFRHKASRYLLIPLFRETRLPFKFLEPLLKNKFFLSNSYYYNTYDFSLLYGLTENGPPFGILCNLTTRTYRLYIYTLTDFKDLSSRFSHNGIIIVNKNDSGSECGNPTFSRLVLE